MSLHLSRRGALALLASLGSTPALAACAPADGGGGRTPPFRDTSLGCDLGEPEPVALAHATRFSMDRFPAGEVLLCLANGERHLVLPEGAEPPRGLAGDVSALRRPLSDVYLVSTAMICVLDAIGALDAVGLAPVTAEDCPVEALAARIEEGAVAYGGRYDAPDYELVAGRACPLALETNKVNNVPVVRR